MKQKSQSLKSDAESKKVRTGDTVMVMTGASRGLTGVVLSRRGEKVLVQGVNMRKKHVKPTQQNPKGAIIELERPVHISNLCVCVDGKPVKLKTRTNDSGQRELYYLNGSEAITYRSIKHNK